MREPIDFLGLPGVRTLSAPLRKDRHGREFYAVEAETTDPLVRHGCDPSHLRIHERRAYKAKDIARGDTGVHITFRMRRYRCLACGTKGFTETLPHLASGRRMTERLHRHIMGRSPRRNFTEIAADAVISDGTVRNVFKSTMRQIVRATPRAPLVLGLDEKYLRGRLRGVICDVGRGRVLEITENRTKAVWAYLNTMEDRERTRVVTMDMHTGYLMMARGLFPNATVVVDKFHVLRRANFAINEYRKALAKRDGRESKIARQRLRGAQKLVWKRWHKLGDEQREKLERLFQQWPELGVAYETKEDFFSFYATPSPHAAAMAYGLWEDSVPPSCRPWFKEHCFLSNYWKPHIFAYLDEPYTNAYVESMNRKLDDLHREGRNLSLDTIRYKMIFDADRLDALAASALAPALDPTRVEFYLFKLHGALPGLAGGSAGVTLDPPEVSYALDYDRAFSPPT